MKKKRNFRRVRYLLIIISVLFCLTSCRKEPKHNYESHSIELSKEITIEGFIKYSWPKVNSDEFVRYELYQAESPMSDLWEGQQLDADLFFSTDKSINTFFLDTNLNTISKKYIKLVARLEHSALSSEILVNNDISTVTFPSILSSSLGIVKTQKESEVIITSSTNNSSSSLYLIDINKGEIINQKSSVLGHSSSFKIGKYQDQMALWNYTYNELRIYSILDLSLLQSISVGIGAPALLLNNNYLSLRMYNSSNNEYNYLNYNITNQSLDTFYRSSTINNSYNLNQAFSPKKLYMCNLANDSVVAFSISPNGEITQGQSRTVQGLYNTGSHTMPVGDVERILPLGNPAKLYDGDFNLLNTFEPERENGFPINSAFYDVSPDLKNYLYRNFGTFNTLLIYQEGNKDVQQKYSIRSSTIPLAFLQNDFLVLVTRSIENSSERLIFNKIPIK